MGGRPSTVLDRMLQNCDQFRGQDPGMNPGQLEISCASEWPTFGVGWPPAGTPNLSIIRAVRLIVPGSQGTRTSVFIQTGGRR